MTDIVDVTSKRHHGKRMPTIQKLYYLATTKIREEAKKIDLVPTWGTIDPHTWHNTDQLVIALV